MSADSAEVVETPKAVSDAGEVATWQHQPLRSLELRLAAGLMKATADDVGRLDRPKAKEAV